MKRRRVNSRVTSVAAVSWDEVIPADVRPPWAPEEPEPEAYSPLELRVAGAMSTEPPFNAYHPAWALPMARVALRALSEWERDNDRLSG